MYSPGVSPFGVARTLTENKSKRRADRFKSLWEDKENGCKIPKIRRIQNQEVVQRRPYREWSHEVHYKGICREGSGESGGI